MFSGIDFDSVELDKWKKHGSHSFLKKPVQRSVILKALDDLRSQTNFINFQITLDPVVEYEKPLLVH